MGSADVPAPVIRRLPLYLRALMFLVDEGQEIISSEELGKKLGISPAQIRKDLSYFGEFGKQGTGYEIKHLREQLKRILKVDRGWGIALVGAGDLGHAIVHYEGFKNRGFHIAAIFDNDPQKIGKKIGDLEIRDSRLLPKVVKEMGLQVAIVAVPASEARKVVDTLIALEIKAILNYAPITLSVPAGVQIRCIDPVTRLQYMTYYL